MANKRRTALSSPGNPRKAARASWESRQNKTENQTTKRRRRKRGSTKRSPWLLVGGIVVLVAAIIGLFVFLSKQSSSGSNGQSSVLADATTLKQVTNIDPGLLSQTGTGNASNPFQGAQGSSAVLTGPTSKPEVFFYGAEWCPLCAAERWGIIVAISRFGTFHTLRETTPASDDSYPNTSTFTFSQSNYTSSYVDFVPLEN